MLEKLLSRVALTLAGVVAGTALAILILKLRPQTGMGFDALADGLGALFLGVVGGAVAGFVAALLLAPRATWIAAAAAIVVGVPLLFIAARLPQNRGPQPEVVAPFEPTFVVQMYSRIAPGDPGPPVEAGDFKHREFRVSAKDRTFSSKGWGEPAERSYCSGDLAEDELGRLADLAKDLYDAGVENCAESGAGTFSVMVEWQGDTRGAAGFGFQCEEQPALTAFLVQFDRVRARFTGQGSCR